MNNDQRPAPAAVLPNVCASSRLPLLRLAEELTLREPIEAIPSGCAKQVRVLGSCTMLGHPAFYVLWTLWAPQLYESLWLRGAMVLCGACLFALPRVMRHPRMRRYVGVLYSLLLWLTLPCFFSWMFLFNWASSVSVVSLAAMVLVYYQLTDWRLASLGTAAALLAVRLIAPAAGWAGMGVPFDQWFSDVAVLASCWLLGWILGLSSNGVRRSLAKTTTSSVAIFAHELRTPLATIHMLAHALREIEPGSDCAGDRLSTLSERLESTIHRLNRQIDLQISSARQRSAPSSRELVSAADTVKGVGSTFPLRQHEANWVVVEVRHEFQFEASSQLFTQVMENLLANAIRALRAAPTDRKKRVALSVDVRGNVGVITCSDNGVGMSPDLVERLFQPFVSTQTGGTHGLGLAFCAETVRAAGGEIHVASAAFAGTEFTIHLPRA